MFTEPGKGRGIIFIRAPKRSQHQSKRSKNEVIVFTDGHAEKFVKKNKCVEAVWVFEAETWTFVGGWGTSTLVMCRDQVD